MILYRNATIDDMSRVAEVHVITQPEYFTSTLGTDLLTKFYTEFLWEDNLFIVAEDRETEEIVGFCMGNWFGSKAEKNWEKKYKSQIIKKLLLNCLKLNKLAISRVLRRVKGLLKKKANSTEIYYSHLLSLGVLPEYRGKHIASTLIDAFEARCLESPPKNEKIRNCTIGAYKWNIAGCSLYKTKGYTVFEETKTKVKFTKDLNK